MEKTYSAGRYFWFAFHFFWGSILGGSIAVIASFSTVAILLVLGTEVGTVSTLVPYIFWSFLVVVIGMVWFVTREDAFI